jgi:hypothetical protein
MGERQFEASLIGVFFGYILSRLGLWAPSEARVVSHEPLECGCEAELRQLLDVKDDRLWWKVAAACLAAFAALQSFIFCLVTAAGLCGLPCLPCFCRRRGVSENRPQREEVRSATSSPPARTYEVVNKPSSIGSDVRLSRLEDARARARAICE